MDQQAKKDLKERVTGLGRRTREERVNWNQVTALRFQTGMGVGWGGETSDIPSFPSGAAEDDDDVDAEDDEEEAV